MCGELTAPPLSTTACTASPQVSSGRPMTAHEWMPACSCSAASISAVERSGLGAIVEGQKIGYDMERDSRSGKMSACNLQAA